MTLVYDGTFECFLSLVYDVYYQKLKVEKILRFAPKTLFYEDIVTIEYEEQKTQKVLLALQQKFSKKHFETLLNIFLCDAASFEYELLEFIVLGFRDQKELENINNKSVFAIQNLQKEYFRQYHKMSGFLRFEELEDGTLYAKLDTKYNLVYYLGKHFLKRFNNQNYVIHDTKRKLAFVKNEFMTGVQEVADVDLPSYSKDEQKFQKLWRTFFKHVSIDSRENKKVQRQFVPFIYRVYMNEFNSQ